jgi:inner membrane protein
MDNITHTLIGVLVGEAAARGTSSARSALEPAARRNLLVTMMGVGSNLPDLDFIYSTITGSKLDYLLHHRGHTHTLAGIVGVALLLAWGAHWWVRRRGVQATRADHWTIWLIALLAPSLHIAMDAANNYGVHPWWPINSQWFYGDSIFIIEPLFWAACAPLLFILRARVTRALVALVLIGGLVLAIVTQMVPFPGILIYLVLATALAVTGWKLPARFALAAGVGLWLTVTASFAFISNRVHAQVQEFSAAAFPSAQLIDAVVTPMPVNPLCWEVILVQRDADVITLRRAMFASAPKLLAADRCPGRALDRPITAPLQPVKIASSTQLQWHGELSYSRNELLQLWNEHCQADALMRFVRAPWVSHLDEAWVLGDLRYDREAELGFAELSIDPPDESCPRYIPDWIAPRADLR